MDNFGLPNLSFETSNTPLLLAILIFFLLTIFYLKSKLSNYLRKRNKLKDIAEKYEKKREYRSGLAVSKYFLT